LRQNKLQPRAILLTHHHPDHTDGVKELQGQFDLPVYSAADENRKLPFQTKQLSPKDKLRVGPFCFTILELPGHTRDHIAYWEEDRNWLFSGDVLFGLGCGRIFDGTIEQMYESLQKLKKLPDQTLVFCTHEYTEKNLHFCKRISPTDNLSPIGGSEELDIYENQLQHQLLRGVPSVPLKLSLEKRVNPFLVARNLTEFSTLRELRNKA
jgi:hydroxyacylglutathione hydrolase